MIIVDTNVIYALGDTSDTEHARCRAWLSRTGTEALLVPSTVVAEVCYLLDRRIGPHAEAAFLDELGDGSEHTFQLGDLVVQDVRRMADLVRTYADRNLGGTDASIIAIAERLDVRTIATVNRRDFDNVRPEHVPAFSIVPD